MGSFVELRRWLYGGMASGLGEVQSGNPQPIILAMAAAVEVGGSLMVLGFGLLLILKG
jgi:hypothetical protein